MIHLAWWGYTIGETRDREKKEECAGDKYRHILSVSGWVYIEFHELEEMHRDDVRGLRVQTES